MTGLFIGLRLVVAVIWIAAAFAGLRRWGRKAALWVLLSLPVALALVAALPYAVLYWLCTRPPGCLSAGL
jgi:hypothetical protein